MDLEQALSAAIEERPDDDAGWLVLADWLTDRGESERAEIVRLQVRLRQDLDAAERGDAERRLQYLLAEGVRPWLPRRTLTLQGGVELPLVLIPPGHFLMGSPARERDRDPGEGPAHVVTLTRAFWMGVTPVTQAQWGAVTGENPSRFDGDDRPVEQVSWDDALGFCQELARSLDVTEQGRFRLPTEAEWEYACRAGTTTPFHSGESVEALRQVGWCNYEALSETTAQTRPVGQLLPNAFGLYDMHGNVWEWCLDGYGSYPDAEVVDPICAPLGPGRVVRGGSWFFASRIARSAFRWYYSPEVRTDSNGCRVVMAWDPPNAG